MVIIKFYISDKGYAQEYVVLKKQHNDQREQPPCYRGEHPAGQFPCCQGNNDDYNVFTVLLLRLPSSLWAGGDTVSRLMICFHFVKLLKLILFHFPANNAEPNVVKLVRTFLDGQAVVQGEDRVQRESLLPVSSSSPSVLMKIICPSLLRFSHQSLAHLRGAFKNVLADFAR